MSVWQLARLRFLRKRTPNYTEDEQPIDDGFGRLVKQYVGAQLDEWLDDDANLERCENSTLTASEQRILLSHWFADAVEKAFEKTRALRAYFEHTGCLMTIDGSEDHLTDQAQGCAAQGGGEV